MADKGGLSRDDAKQQLKAISKELHRKFPEATDRLHQLDSHLATVAMVVDHIHDEAARAAAEKEAK